MLAEILTGIYIGVNILFIGFNSKKWFLIYLRSIFFKNILLHKKVQSLY